MLYLILIVILAEAVYQTLYYRTSKEALRSHISFYILCALFFLLIASSSIYITKLNDINLSLSNFMLMDHRFWNRFIIFRFDMSTLVRIMIFCTQLIPFASLTFILFFTEHSFHSSIRLLFPALICCIFGALFFDPAIQKWCYYCLYPEIFSYQNYFSFVDFISLCARLINWGIILFSFFMLLYYVVFQLPRYRELTISSFCILICHGIISVSFLYLFYWLPSRLVKVSKLVDSVTYLPVSVHYPPFIYNGFLIFQFLALGILVTALFFQTRYMLSLKSDIRTIHTSKDILQASSRIFAHYMKNEILAIQSEAELAQYSGHIEDKNTALSNIHLRCSQIWEHLEYAYSTANSPKLILKRVNLNHLITHELDKMKELFHEQGIEVIISMDKDISLQVDISSFSNVIHNIFSNSIDALAEKGDGQKWIQVQVKSYRSWVSIHIKDNGCGITREAQKHIFTPFYSSKPSKTNWGLGLTLCQKIILAHNGRIQLESISGKYTVVKILLPYLKEEKY